MASEKVVHGKTQAMGHTIKLKNRRIVVGRVVDPKKAKNGVEGTWVISCRGLLPDRTVWAESLFFSDEGFNNLIAAGLDLLSKERKIMGWDNTPDGEKEEGE